MLGPQLRNLPIQSMWGFSAPLPAQPLMRLACHGLQPLVMHVLMAAWDALNIP